MKETVNLLNINEDLLGRFLAVRHILKIQGREVEYKRAVKIQSTYFNGQKITFAKPQ